MNIQSNSFKDDQPKCKGCKLFFGAQAFQGYCSSCFKKQQGSAKENVEKVKAQHIEVKQNPVAKPPIQQKQEQVQKDKKRCNDCKKKVGDLGIQCKCGFVFCNKHRLPEDHKCSIDYLSLGTKNLQKNLVKLSHQKMEKMQ